MIALRGKLEKGGEGADKGWKWKGVWAFGQSIESSTALPFEYTMERPVSPSQVLVPSAEQPESEREGGGEKLAGGDDSGDDKPETKSSTTDSEANKDSSLPEETSTFTASTPKNHQSVVNESHQNGNESYKKAPLTIDSKDPPASSPETKAVTFATKESDSEPDFTDASKIYPQCPPSGEWRGFFETLSSRKGAPSTTTKIPESCHLFLNATPPPDAKILFDDGDPDTDNSEATMLPPGHVHVRGMGKNQYGVFELIGSFSIETQMLQCQRMYVITTPATTPRGSGRRRQKSTPDSTDSHDRPYTTRKRQMSWKKRAAIMDSDEDASSQGRRRVARGSSFGGSVSSQKRMKTSIGFSSEGPLGTSIGGKRLTVTIPDPSVAVTGPGTASSTGSGKRSQSSPRPVASAARKRSSSVRCSMNSGSASAVGLASHLKLPTLGDPHKARWRAAHFLYYHREIPEDGSSGRQPSGHGAASPTGSSEPKYVVYEGEMASSYRDGRGACLYNNGQLYEGSWKRDKEHGFGTLMTADRKRIIYSGEWERGKMSGRGTYYYNVIRLGSNKKAKEYTRYEGEFKENLRHGTGSYYLKDGSVYVGSWRDGSMNGRGIFTWPDGSVYEGEWKDGKRHGQGVLTSSDGFSYDGMWAQNSMEGRGSATYPNGQRYVGLFTAGRREGRGTMLFTNGAIYEGRFRDDAVDGQGTLRLSRALVIPGTAESGSDDESGDLNQKETKKDDFMIPLSFQSDLGQIHRKAGFTIGGD